MTTRQTKTTSDEPETPAPELTFTQKFALIQKRLKVPKSRENKFGNYKYRSAEDILDKAKELCYQYDLILTCSDRIVILPSNFAAQVFTGKDGKGKTTYDVVGGDRFYVHATARISDGQGSSVETHGYARESDFKSGMDSAQITGAASSYARKYALNGLLAIDDNKDPDTDEFQQTIDSGRAETSRSKTATKPATQNDQTRQKAMNQLHAKADELGYDHDYISNLAKSVYGVNSITQLREAQIREMISELGATPPASTDPIPPELQSSTPGPTAEDGPQDFTALWKELRQHGVTGMNQLVDLIGEVEPSETAPELWQRYVVALLKG